MTAPTVLTLSRTDRAWITAGPAALGLALALLLPPAARLLLDLGTPLPFGFVVKAVARVDVAWELGVQAALLIAAGLLTSAVILRQVTRVTVAGDEVELRTGDERRSIPRDAIGALYPERDALVVLDHDSRQMFHGEPGASRERLRVAFREHGYPWHDADPFAGLYHRWAPETGTVPIEVEAVLSARAVALRKKAGKEAGELRDSLQRLGYAVRDEGGQQFWRPLVRQ
ncbi:hypothetical protein [Actinoplanes sp. DH11]|uniref:YqeB family protein n=1 Tax=Actinoplanes sp. DH11 TaxID=2857011 RepID=UPI001E37566E|nr:hypothetical protein [Actinoplanes sp. DH11]